MLTLQQLLESDSLATIVAKLNNNFQILNASNGGPQGIRGQQGIPGLPGRLGPLGPTGAQGPTGTLLGIVPFACVGDSTAGVGPTSGQLAPNLQSGGEWPFASWTWLMYYHGSGITSTFAGFTNGTGTQPRPGDIYVDHANKGYWKYLDSADEVGACASGTSSYPAEYISGGIYSNTGITGSSYPSFTGGLGFVGNGWYWYPTTDPTISLGTDVWVNDVTTYLLSPTASGPYTGSNPLSVPNARLVSKYGSVWITSGSESPADDNDLGTSTINGWGSNSGQLNPARTNSGIDRLLFKMSIDTIPYLGNITARGFTAAAGAAYTISTTHPVSEGNTAMQSLQAINYWVKPQYDTTLEKYSPLLFLSERNPDGYGLQSNYSSLGLYMHTSIIDAETKDNLNKSLFLWSSRYSPDPIEMFPTGFTGIDSASTKNFGEFIMDTRRLIASNQYVCSVPTDMKLSGDWIDYTGVPAYYEESNVNNPYSYRTFQGYISSINGKSITGNPSAIDYWEYGLGDGSTYGLTAGTHDTSSGLTGMQTRTTWYGSSVFDELPSGWNGLNPGEGNYIRVAGMMDRGRRFFDSGSSDSHFLSELVFYTSHFTKAAAATDGISNGDVDPTINEHKSLPVMYMSPYRNIGIGTFVGDTYNTSDKGPLEPTAQLHVHSKQKLREDDPTYTYIELFDKGLGVPNRIFTVAAFSGDYTSPTDSSATDILLGNLYTQTEEWVNPINGNGDVVNRMSDNDTAPGANVLRNAIRSESWSYSRHNTLRFGAQSILSNSAIGKDNVDYFKTQFQLAIHPLIKDTTLDESDNNQSISGIGIHNLYPRTRMHLFGKNLYNEVDWGEEDWTPGDVVAPSGVGVSYPYYPGKDRVNSPSANQIAIDYIGDSYTYPVGIYEYQYYSYGATANPGSTGSISPNAAVYPSRDKLSPTRHAVPFEPDYVNFAYPAAGANITFNDAYRHGGTANAWWEPTSYIGFNLIRDVSEAGTTGGDNRDNTRWLLGRNYNADDTTSNNGGSAIISSPHGELGIINIPRGRDGGHPYTQWEQRGLGTRDVLNQMKIVFDKNGNIAVGNAAGWDMDAYPSLDRDSNGYLQYVPIAAATTTVPATAGTNSSYTWFNRWNTSFGQYGLLDYIGYPESETTSSAALINSQATQAEYIRLEIAAEKAWSRDGRMAQKTGWGYPPNTTLTLNVANGLGDYINLSLVSLGLATWTLTTDAEGRIVSSIFNLGVANPGLSVSNFPAVVYPHPIEFNATGALTSLAPGFVAPVGAIAAEWWGMSVDHPADDLGDTVIISGGEDVVTFIPTTDLRGSANIRLNNFVYGEGYGFGGPGGQTADGAPDETDVADFTKNLVKQKRQESPKLIFTFLEGNVSTAQSLLRGPGSGKDPYKKVSTVIQSAQNESSLREYWIPKADNTGGTFMVFTDHFGVKEKNDGFDTTSIKVTTTGTGGVTGDYGLHLDQVVTMEFLAGYTGSAMFVKNTTELIQNIDGQAPLSPLDILDNMYPGYVRYSNRDYTWPGQNNTVFSASQYGRKLPVGIPDTTAEILQLGAERDAQYTIIKIESPDPNYAIQNDNTTTVVFDANNCVLIKPDSNAAPVFTNGVIEDSDYTVTGIGLTGSIVSTINTTELQFIPNLNALPDLTTPDRIKVTIDFAAAGMTGTGWHATSKGPLYIGLIPDDGMPSLWDKAQMTASCLANDYFGTIWGSDGIEISTADAWTVYENQISFYIPYTDWTNYTTWKLGMMIREAGDLDSAPVTTQFLTWADGIKVSKFEIKFEEIYNPAETDILYQETEILPLPSSGTNLSTVHRNIDHYYSIESFSIDPDLGDNQSSAVRFKRINSEFALVDFNITVKVHNPVLPGGAATNSFDYIDFCSPRFTQYLRFVYVPDEDFNSEPTYRQDISQDIYGNGMWFSQWSTYKQWYAGTAIVGNKTTARSYYTNSIAPLSQGPGFKTSTSDGSPFFTEPNVAVPSSGFRTWTGNYLDILSYYTFSPAFGAGKVKENSIYKSEGNVTPITDVYTSTLLPTDDPTQRQRSGIYSAFGNDRRILQIAKAMFNKIGTASEVGAKQFGFVQFLGAAYSLWHNNTYMRNKNIQWRMVPAQSYIYKAGAVDSSLTKNNTFVLEVQFSDPMLHVDTSLGEAAFIGTAGDAVDQFYQYLTVSGQAIIRYAETKSDGNSGSRNLNP